MKMIKSSTSEHKSPKQRLVREMYGGEVYEYFPLGKYVVAAPGICGGRPTFKYTRLEVSMILALLATGKSVEQIVRDYADSKLTSSAIKEAIRIADKNLLKSTRILRKAA